MKRCDKKFRRELRALVALVLAAGAAHAEVQRVLDGEQEYPPLTLPQLRYLKTDVEFEQISDTPASGSGSQTERIYLSPVAGIAWNYFLYHPNLLTYQILAEPGYMWQQFRTDSGTSGQDALMLNGSFNATLLALKPYSTSFNYSRSHGDYHYDFFNSATVDAETYGMTTGYRQGRVPFTISIQHTETDNSGLLYSSTTEQLMLNLHAQIDRARGNTDLSYQFTDYTGTYSNSGDFNSEEATHSLTLTDVEHLSDRLTLNSTVYYTRYESQGQASDNPSLALDLNWNMTPHLRSYYDASVSDYLAEGSSSLNSSLRMGLEHQLYESLTSTVEIHGADSSTDAGDASTVSDALGGSLAEAYNKRLGEWGNLSINNTVTYDYTMQQTSGGLLPVFDEGHTVTAGGLLLTPLNLPRVISVTSVTYQNGITPIPLLVGDYNLIAIGELTQIQLTASGLAKLAAAVPPANSVKVTYTVQPNPTGNYSTLNNQTEIRLGFWQQRASIFARYNFSDNRADTAGFVFDNYDELQAGADLNWGKFRLDATYTDRHSSLYGYRSLTTSEGYTIFYTQKSSASLDFNQQWNWFASSGSGTGTTDLSYYSFTAHYDWHPLNWLNWRNETGYELQRGSGSNRDYLVARSYLSCTFGKLDVNLGYEFENQKYTGEIRNRNYAFLRVKRNF